MEKKMDHWRLIILTVTGCVLLYIIEQVLGVTYPVKTGAKIILFMLIPLFYIKYVNKKPIFEFLNVHSVDWKNLRLGFFLGFISMAIVIAAYFIFQDFIQADVIMNDLTKRLKITPERFLYVAFYITFGNSLLEEFYFRGFIFLNLYNRGLKAFAHVFSALLFSLYHVAIFAVWFNVWLMLLALAGLFIVGLVLNYLNTKSGNFLNSWILHILADIGVMIIGFYLFGFFG